MKKSHFHYWHHNLPKRTAQRFWFAFRGGKITWPPKCQVIQPFHWSTAAAYPGRPSAGSAGHWLRASVRNTERAPGPSSLDSPAPPHMVPRSRPLATETGVRSGACPRSSSSARAAAGRVTAATVPARAPLPACRRTGDSSGSAGERRGLLSAPTLPGNRFLWAHPPCRSSKVFVVYSWASHLRPTLDCFFLLLNCVFSSKAKKN
jgi:hypothetical protein